MADITLADYAGYIFLEIIKARQMADQYSKGVAEVYAQDPVMKFFSVPRFKVPKMELTIPVLVSGARFSQVLRFKLTGGQFSGLIIGRLPNFFQLMKAEVKPDEVYRVAERDKTIPKLLNQEYSRLIADLGHSDGIVAGVWNETCNIVREALQLPMDRRFEEALAVSTKELLGLVTANIVVDSTQIESLLINPETNVVKTGSSDSSVFTIKAEMLEEGFFIRSVKDEGGQERQIVEFE